MTPRRLLSLLAAAAALAPAAAPGAAQAGTYVVHSCRTPDGAPASTDGWTWSATDPALTGFAPACPNGGITLRLLPGRVHDRDATANMRFTAPASTEVVRYRIWRSVRLTAAERYYFSPTEAVPGGSEEWAMTACGGMTNSCTAVGSPATPLGAANLLDRTPPNPLSRYGVYLSCGLYRAEDPDCRATSPVSAEATVWRAETTLLDDDWPAFPAAPAGSLLDGGALSGVHRLSTIAIDKGGGIAATSLEVDGQVVAQATFGDAAGSCREPYAVRVPCPTTASGTLALDTATLPDGAHRLRVLATDAAGNTAAWGPATFATDNASALCAPAATPPGTPLRLRTWVTPAAAPRRAAGRDGSAGRGRRGGSGRRAGRAGRGRRGGGRGRRGARAAAAAARRRSATVPMGRGAVVGGRLEDAAGAPVAGAAVCVSSRVGDGGALVPLARLSTGADGRFAVPVPAGTSRQLWAVHRVAGGAVSAKALLRVRARVSLRPARSRLRAGQVLVMRGRLAGRPFPRGGVLVNVQAKRGREWQTFRQVRAGGDGRFRVRYRFVGAGGVHRYALRAAVPQQGAYPYAPAASRAFRVRVAG